LSKKREGSGRTMCLSTPMIGKNGVTTDVSCETTHEENKVELWGRKTHCERESAGEEREQGTGLRKEAGRWLVRREEGQIVETEGKRPLAA